MAFGVVESSWTFQGSYTRVVANPKDPKKAKDRKTYVINPSGVGMGGAPKSDAGFSKGYELEANLPVKLDIFLVLVYTQAFLKYYEEARIENLELEIFLAFTC